MFHSLWMKHIAYGLAKLKHIEQTLEFLSSGTELCPNLPFIPRSWSMTVLFAFWSKPASSPWTKSSCGSEIVTNTTVQRKCRWDWTQFGCLFSKLLSTIFSANVALATTFFSCQNLQDIQKICMTENHILWNKYEFLLQVQGS